jgi:ribonuclease HI
MIKAYFDGACEPVNPGGTASYGVVIFKDGKRIYEMSKIFKPSKKDKTSNNVAEYNGFLEILNYLRDNGYQDEIIKVYGDSQLVIKQMFGHWRIKKGLYKPYALLAKLAVASFPRISGKWIPREENSLADEISKRELRNMGITFRIQPE